MTGKAIFLHLSDLHFGDENETNAAKRKNTLKKLLLTLKNLPTEWKPQSIAISGDIGWRSLENDYNMAEVWLMELLTTLDLTADDIIPAPGNHDINLKKAAATAVPSDHIRADELLDLDLLENISTPFKGFEDFCKRMKIPPLSLGSKSSYLAGCRVHKGITWLVLNSAWFCREGRNEKLHIGLPHLEVITAGECDMILSGHVHGMLKAPDTMYQKSYLFTGGSCYSDERVRNNFSIFRVEISSGGTCPLSCPLISHLKIRTAGHPLFLFFKFYGILKAGIPIVVDHTIGKKNNKEVIRYV